MKSSRNKEPLTVIESVESPTNVGISKFPSKLVFQDIAFIVILEVSIVTVCPIPLNEFVSKNTLEAEVGGAKYDPPTPPEMFDQ
tara:strand:+ start:10565 stop:10816 length:252 start_codon:yes stop_codon:yes gene_type:complete